MYSDTCDRQVTDTTVTGKGRIQLTIYLLRVQRVVSYVCTRFLFGGRALKSPGRQRRVYLRVWYVRKVLREAPSFGILWKSGR